MSEYQRYRVNVCDDVARLFVESSGHVQIVTNRVPVDLGVFFQAMGIDQGDNPAGLFAFLTNTALNGDRELHMPTEAIIEYWRALWVALKAGEDTGGFRVFDMVAGPVGAEDLQRWGIEVPAWLLPEGGE